MFHRYLNKPEATSETFTHDGWFKTGDAAISNYQKYLFFYSE